MTHSLAANALPRHLNSASVTDDSAIPNAFVFTAVALVIFDGTKNLLAEETILFRLIRAVVDCLGLHDFT